MATPQRQPPHDESLNRTTTTTANATSTGRKTGGFGRGYGQRSSNHKEDWESMFTSHPKEYECELECVSGQIPQGLKGCFWRNGPGLFDVGDMSNIHNIDGDGMLVRVSFCEGRVFFSNRYTISKHLKWIVFVRLLVLYCTYMYAHRNHCFIDLCVRADT